MVPANTSPWLRVLLIVIEGVIMLLAALGVAMPNLIFWAGVAIAILLTFLSYY